MPRTKPVSELAQVTEIASGENQRRFRATCADGSVCPVTQIRPNDCEWLFCNKHGADDCEGAERVRLTLLDERIHKGLIRLIGYTARGDGKTEGPIEGKARFGVVRGAGT